MTISSMDIKSGTNGILPCHTKCSITLDSQKQMIWYQKQQKEHEFRVDMVPNKEISTIQTKTLIPKWCTWPYSTWLFDPTWPLTLCVCVCVCVSACRTCLSVFDKQCFHLPRVAHEIRKKKCMNKSINYTIKGYFFSSSSSSSSSLASFWILLLFYYPSHPFGKTGGGGGGFVHCKALWSYIGKRYI